MDEIKEELINYLDKRFTRIEKDLDFLKENSAAKEDVSRMRNSIDAYVKQSEDSKQEYHMLENQIDRHDKWLQKIAIKTKLKLEY